MKGQGSSTLWLMAIGLIALFMLATMVAPALLHSTQSSTDKGTSSGGNDTQPLIFQAPTSTMSVGSVKLNGLSNFTVRAAPYGSTTGDGGSYAWVLSLEGANGQANAVIIDYQDQQVQWYPGPSGSEVGIGPRFSQGPGAEAMAAEASLSLIPNLPGNYTLKAWIVEVSVLQTLDPSGLKACSPIMTQNFTVADTAKPVAPAVKVDQSLTIQTDLTVGRWVPLVLSDSGQATGKWKGSITDMIALQKSGIRATDVLLRVSTDNGWRYVSWTDNGGRLVTSLSANTPFAGGSNSESKQWTMNMEIEFITAGTYSVQNWAVETGKSNALSSTDSQSITVKSSSPAPAVPNTTPTNTTGTSTSAPSIAPVVNSSSPSAPPSTPVVTPTPTNQNTGGNGSDR